METISYDFDPVLPQHQKHHLVLQKVLYCFLAQQITDTHRRSSHIVICIVCQFLRYNRLLT